MSEPVEIECEVLGSTNDAIMIENLKWNTIWIPKSQISDYSSDDNVELNQRSFNPTSIFIPEWLAISKDLI